MLWMPYREWKKTGNIKDENRVIQTGICSVTDLKFKGNFLRYTNLFPFHALDNEISLLKLEHFAEERFYKQALFYSRSFFIEAMQRAVGGKMQNPVRKRQSSLSLSF